MRPCLSVAACSLKKPWTASEGTRKPPMRAHSMSCDAGVLHRCIKGWNHAGDGDSHDHRGPFSHTLVGRRAIEAVQHAVAAQGKLTLTYVVIKAQWSIAQQHIRSFDRCKGTALSLQRYLCSTATLWMLRKSQVQHSCGAGASAVCIILLLRELFGIGRWSRRLQPGTYPRPEFLLE